MANCGQNHIYYIGRGSESWKGECTQNGAGLPPPPAPVFNLLARELEQEGEQEGERERPRDRIKIAVPRGTSILNRFRLNRAPASDSRSNRGPAIRFFSSSLDKKNRVTRSRYSKSRRINELPSALSTLLSEISRLCGLESYQTYHNTVQNAGRWSALHITQQFSIQQGQGSATL